MFEVSSLKFQPAKSFCPCKAKISAKKGFTIVEILVSLSILLLLSAILLPQYASVRAKFALLRNVYQVAQDIRIAREMAISTQAISGSVPPGYGVFLKEGETKYVIYIDVNGNQSYNASGDRIFKQIDLNVGVEIRDISTPSPAASINFKGPDPVVAISGGGDVRITLGLKGGGSESKTITVNGAGLIYVE